MNSSQHPRVVTVTVTYGDRWPMTQQAADALLRDERMIQFVVVDNGSVHAAAMDVYAADHAGRVTVLHEEKNRGYSAGIATALAHARTLDAEHVFVLDDDMIPEEDAISYFLQTLSLFPDPQKIALGGNRVDVADNAKVFCRPPATHAPSGSVFEIFSLGKLVNLARLLLRIPKPAAGPYVPVLPTLSLVTGGSFLPMQAVRDTPLPDASLFIYGEDLEYSWRMRRLGYETYVCARPYLHDADLTFAREGDHIFDLFKPSFADFKTYFRLRNAVIISRRNTVQRAPILFLNVLLWTLGLLAIGLFRYGFTATYWKRACIIVRAIRDGYSNDRTPPPYLSLPI